MGFSCFAVPYITTFALSPHLRCLDENLDLECRGFVTNCKNDSVFSLNKPSLVHQMFQLATKGIDYLRDFLSF